MYKIISTLHGYDTTTPVSIYQSHRVYSWYVPAIKQCQRLNPNCEIHIITDLDLRGMFDGNVYIHPLIKSPDVDFMEKNFINLSSNPGHYEYNSIIRFMYLKNFCVANDIDKFLYLESDVVVFSDVMEDKEYMKSSGYKVTLMHGMCAGVVFFVDAIKTLNTVCDWMVGSYSDPQRDASFNMAEFKKAKAEGSLVGGVCDMHFWSKYGYECSDTTLLDMDKNDNGVFWQTCMLGRIDGWEHHIDSDINRPVKTLCIENDRCYAVYHGERLQVKYLHFNENSKLLIPNYTA